MGAGAQEGIARQDDARARQDDVPRQDGTAVGTAHDGASSLGTVTHVCRVSQLHDDAGTIGVTAIDKRPVDGALKVGRYGLYGDVQADRKNHGGPEKALYVLDQAEADHWAAELGEDVAPGRFGENLRISGLRVDDAEIGERWRIGESLEVEVTGPRTPCATFGRWLGQERWVRRFTEHGRTGVYLRVVTPGPVRAGDGVSRVSRPGHGVTVSGWFTRQHPEDARALLEHESRVRGAGDASRDAPGDGPALVGTPGPGAALVGAPPGDGAALVGAPGPGAALVGAPGDGGRFSSDGVEGGSWEMAQYLREYVERAAARAGADRA